MVETDRHKRLAALAAVERIQSGMVVGLGSGSTARYAIEEIADRLSRGRLGDVSGVPTSEETAALAARLGIPLVELGQSPVALAIDGADEVAPDLSVTKGGGGAHLREKIVAAAAHRVIIIADESKLVPALGSSRPIPVEVARFGAAATMALLRRFGHPQLRRVAGEPFVTDNGNWVADLQVEPIDEPARWDQLVSAVPGVLATGVFADLVGEALIGGAGDVKVLLPR